MVPLKVSFLDVQFPRRLIHVKTFQGNWVSPSREHDIAENLVLGLLSLDGGFDREEVVQRIGYNDFEKIVLQDAQIYAMYTNRQDAEMPRRRPPSRAQPKLVHYMYTREREGVAKHPHKGFTPL
jgi:hypothetical protein